jgi:hypothetical protein
MASSYTDIGTELMATGENAGVWGTKTNTNLQILEEAINGYVSQALTSGGTVTLTYTDGSVGDVARHAVIALTGALSGNAVVEVPANEKIWIIDNQSTNAYTVTVRVNGQTGVTWGTSDKGTKILYANGTDVVDTNIGGGVGAHDLNGNTLTLDADADTDITADTDDQIDIRIAGADDFQFTANTFTAQAGSTIAAQALTATTITASGIVKTDDTTEATSTTDGSLQTDGGLSVAKDAVLGDDVKLLSDSAVLSFGADSDTTLTHTDGTGLTLNSANKLTFRDTGLTIGSNADGDLDIVSDGTAVDSINLESAGGITLDAGTAGNGIVYEDDGTEMARIHNSSSDVILETKVSDKDFLIKGNDGGSTVTALTLDMSAAGAATFNDKIIATELDISGNMDIDGTSNLDAVDIDGAVQLDATLTIGANDQGYDVILYGDTASANMTWDTSADDLIFNGAAGLIVPDGQFTLGSTAVSATAAEINLIDGGTARGTTAVADGDGLLVNDGGTMRMTNVTTLKTYFQSGVGIAADDISAGDGAVTLSTSSGNITIDATANDTDIIFKGTDNSSDITMLTLDGSDAGSATFNHDIILGNDSFVRFGDAGEKITGDGTDLTVNSSNDLHLTASTDINVPADVGMTFGNDGEKIEGDGTDLTIASSAKLNLTATSDVHIPNNVGIIFGGDSEKIEGDGTDLTISANNLTVDAAADINLDADGADVNIKDGGTTILSFTNSSSDAVVTAGVQDKDIIFKGDDGGSAVTSLTLDMSNSGAAIFSAAAYNAEATLTDGATPSWNAITQPVAKITIAGNRTIGAASGGVAGAFISLLIIQDGTGSRTMTWNAAYEFASDTAPTLTTTANLGDLFVFRYNGSKWLEVGRNLALTLS